MQKSRLILGQSSFLIVKTCILTVYTHRSSIWCFLKSTYTVFVDNGHVHIFYLVLDAALALINTACCGTLNAHK